MTLNLDDLEALYLNDKVRPTGTIGRDHVLALIARLREAEQERDEARWAAGIVGDVARESSGGWQDAAAELHATQARIAAALEGHTEKHGERARFAPGSHYLGEPVPTHWEKYVICDYCKTTWPCKTFTALTVESENTE